MTAILDFFLHRKHGNKWEDWGAPFSGAHRTGLCSLICLNLGEGDWKDSTRSPAISVQLVKMQPPHPNNFKILREKNPKMVSGDQKKKKHTHTKYQYFPKSKSEKIPFLGAHCYVADVLIVSSCVGP